MKKTKIIYWVFTVLLIAAMLLSAIPEIIGSQQGAAIMTKLGYPAYMSMMLGIAKILGITVILIPGIPRLKEWAYAGFCIDLVGATWSQAASGIPVSNWIFMIIWFIPLFGSYIYYHKRLKETPVK